jgi:hypothetical protein
VDKQTWIILVIGAVLGAILSVPFQIVTGLMFPSIQRWTEARLKRLAFAKSRWMREDYLDARHYHDNPHLFTQLILYRMFALLVAIFMLVCCVILMVWVQFFHSSGKQIGISENIVFNLITSLVPMSCALGGIAMIWAATFIKVQSTRVRFFEQYEQRVIEALGSTPIGNGPTEE